MSFGQMGVIMCGKGRENHFGDRLVKGTVKFRGSLMAWANMGGIE